MAESLEIDLAVDFGGVSIGKKTARLGMKVSREGIELERADAALCGRRLNGSIVLGGRNDSPGQGTLVDTDERVDGSFDVTRFGVSPDEFSFGATFMLSEIEISDLAKFSSGKGRLLVNEIGDIPADVVDEHEPAAGFLPGQFKAEGPWRSVSMDVLFAGAVLKSLKAAGIMSVGDMHDYQQPEPNGHTKTLSDIKGLGPAKVEQVEEVMLQFWADNPQEESTEES